jgi:hypothetical protein
MNRLRNTYEGFSSKLTYYSNLKVFGALIIVHIKQYKENVRIVKGISIGYHEGVKGYKLGKIEAGG